MDIKGIPAKIKRFLKFITEDIWRVTPGEQLTKKKRRSYGILQVVYLAIRRYQDDNLQKSASALTYNTFLSIIPFLAVLLSIAKGFGFDNIIQSQLLDYFPGQREILDNIFTFVSSYMEHTKDGLFLGLGLILLLYTVLTLITNVENTFNSIWEVKGRTYLRRITDYFSILILLPLLIICTSGLSIYMSTTFESSPIHDAIAPVYNIILTIAPIVLTVLVFTLLYTFMPNTKVQFKHALIGGAFAGVGFLLFQYLYISGMMWVTKYNAIYGSFALIPLLLLWIQLSWVICLVGAEIAYAGQNVKIYAFETESKNISRRYLDFFTLTIAALIVKRFEKGEPPYTSDELAVESRIPIRLVNRILRELVQLNIINEVKDDNEYRNYQPALDINQITVNYLFEKIDREGSENFKVDHHRRFRKEWDAILKSREQSLGEKGNMLVKDL